MGADCRDHWWPGCRCLAIFVGLQIRQTSSETALNTVAVQVNAYQSLASDVMVLTSLAASNSQLSELVSRIYAGGEFRNAAEQFQFDQYLSAILEHGDMAYYQYQKGIIDEDRLVNIIGIVMFPLRTPYVRRRWDELLRVRVDPSFAAYLEARLAELEIEP